MDAPTRRRRAACAAFDSVLGEDDLYAALWLQHDSMKGEAASDIIRFVDTVADRFGLDTVTRKRLYDSLFRALKLGDNELPIDPWPAMLATRPAPVPARSAAPSPAAPAWPAPPRYAPPYQAPAPVYAAPPYLPPPAYAPVPPPYGVAPPGYVLVPPGPGGMAAAPQVQGLQTQADLAPAATPAAPPAAEPPPAPVAAVDASIWTPDSGVPPEQAVFADLIAHMAADIAQTHAGEFDDWRSGWLAQLQRQKLANAPRDLLLDACRRLGPGQSAADLRTAWRLPLSAAELSGQVNLLYVALCEALGPVAADQVLTRAVKRAEQGPAARLFSPRKLM